MKFVKSPFFSARRFSETSQVRDALPAWRERANNRIHKATRRVPAQVFSEEERPALRPLLPSVHEAAPTNLVPQKVAAQPFMQHRASRCSVPWELCSKTIHYKVIGDRLHVYGPDRRHECTHQVNPVRGSFNRLEEHRRQEATDWMDVAERLRQKWNCAEFKFKFSGRAGIDSDFVTGKRLRDASCRVYAGPRLPELPLGDGGLPDADHLDPETGMAARPR